jgi:hypothetical protein
MKTATIYIVREREIVYVWCLRKIAPSLKEVPDFFGMPKNKSIFLQEENNAVQKKNHTIFSSFND